MLILGDSFQEFFGVTFVEEIWAVIFQSGGIYSGLDKVFNLKMLHLYFVVR